MSEKHSRSILKAASWRFTATLVTFLASWLVSGNLTIAFSIGGIDFFAKLFLYYLHERIWIRIPFGKHKVPPPEYQI